MPNSEYDALLEPPKSEYDALTVAANPTSDLRPPTSPGPSTPAAYLEDKILTGLGATPRAREIVSNAETGIANTLKSFVPQSLSQALGFVTPVVGAFEDVKKGIDIIRDVAGGKSFEEASRANRPEDFALVDADKTPAFSKERFTAGFGAVANMLMAGGIAHGLNKPVTPRLTETLFPESDAGRAVPKEEVPPTTIPPEEVKRSADQITAATSEVTPPTTGEPIEQAPMAEVIAPETTTASPTSDLPAAVESQPGAVPAEAAQATPRTFRGPADAFGSEVTPVAQYLIDNVGGVLSKSAAQKAKRFAGNEDLWNGSQDALSHKTHNKVYNPNGEAPDAAAQALFDAGLINEPTPDAMWAALSHESRTARTLAREERAFSQAEKAAHAEWQDQLKSGERDPAVALRSAGGEPALITRSEDGQGVELSLLDENGDPKVSETHGTLDEALKAAHDLGMRLDDSSAEGQPIFGDETAPSAGAGNVAPAGETAGAPPETGAAPPKLRAGEKQGDLLSTQTEDLSLVGEQGTDHGARAAEAEAAATAKSEYDALTEAAQGKLFERPVPSDIAHDWTGATERQPSSLPIEQHAERVKMKLGGNKEGGFVNADVLGEVVDFGARIYRKGIEFAKWAGDMIKHLGEAIKPHLQTVWDSLTGKNILPRARQSGAIGGIGIRKMSPLDKATAERSTKLQKSFSDAERAQKEIKRAAPTERRQAAISVFMEANGDASTLSQWAAAAKGKIFRQAATDAQSLKPEELAIAQKAQGAFGALEQRGNHYGVLGSHRDNYVPHVWEVSKDFTGIGSSKLQDRFKFNKARTFNNFFEGDQAGFTPKTMAIGKLLPAYLHEMNKVIADRQFIQDLADRTASDGRPLVIPRGTAKTVDASDWIIRNADGSPLPKFEKAVYDTEAEAKAALQSMLPLGQIIEKRQSESALVNPLGFAKAEDAQGNPIDQRDYKVVDQPALNSWRWVETDANGNSTILKSDLAVHPELAKRLKATMGQSPIREWYNEPSTGVSVIPKAIAKGLDTAQSVMKREMFSLLAPFHQVQEGTHAIGHTINPFFGLEDMSRPTPEHIDMMQHGLMLFPDRSSSGAYLEGVGGRGGFIAQAGRWLGEKAGDNVIGKAAERISSVIDGYQNYLFHQYIPSLKAKTYRHIFERNTKRYADEMKAGKVSEADVKLLSAEQTNAAYGHLNYALLDRSPLMQHVMQLSLLAPDFLEARGRFVGQAAKSLVGETAGHEQFRAIAVLAATQAATMYTLSKVLGGEWDWKHPFEMTVGNRRYMLRSVPEDLHRLLFQGPDVRREFVSARINPGLQKVDQLRTGMNYRGEKSTALETLGELFANYIPITVRWLPGMRQLTETSRNSPVSPLEQLAGSMGLKISRYSAITHTHQLAAEWMDKQKIERPQGVYPTSKFTPLRYALEDADLPRAEKEWKKLVGDEGDETKLAEGFKQSITHPFTGNKSRDQDFADSLKGKDRLLYDRALEVREGILDKFSLIH